MTDNCIEIKNLKKSFRKNEVLKGIDLNISAGEVIGYLGSNGAGKSTTVKILCGLIRQFEGEVSILGHNLRTDDLEIKKRIGYIPENAVVYEQLTPVEYLEFVSTLYGMQPDIAHRKITELLELFEMKSHNNERIISFSKGMKQKIHIISGLLHNPDILFMDEPLNGLDANAVIIVKEIITQLAREGKTIFYCSHLMDIVEKISSRIVLIDGGRIIANGTVEQLKQDSGSTSLEELFSKLTGKNDHSEKAGQIIDVFENNFYDSLFTFYIAAFSSPVLQIRGRFR